MAGTSTSRTARAVQRRMHEALSNPEPMECAGERLFSSDRQLAGQRSLPELVAALTRIELAQGKKFRENWLEEEMNRVQNIFGSLSTTVLDDNIERMQNQGSLRYLSTSGSNSIKQAHDDGYDGHDDAGGPSPGYRIQLAKQALYDGPGDTGRPNPEYRSRLDKYLQAIFEQLKLQVAMSDYYYKPHSSRFTHLRLEPRLPDAVSQAFVLSTLPAVYYPSRQIDDKFDERPRNDLFRDVRNMQQHAVAYGANDEDPMMSVANAGEFFCAHAFEQQLKRKIRYSHGHKMGPNEIRQMIRRD